MNKVEFNKYCAEVMGLTLYRGRAIAYQTVCGNDYNPYDDLNQMAEVWDKLMEKENFLLTKWFTYDSNMKRINFKIEDVMRDFIISTKGER